MGGSEESERTLARAVSAKQDIEKEVEKVSTRLEMNGFRSDEAGSSATRPGQLSAQLKLILKPRGGLSCKKDYFLCQPGLCCKDNPRTTCCSGQCCFKGFTSKCHRFGFCMDENGNVPCRSLATNKIEKGTLCSSTGGCCIVGGKYPLCGLLPNGSGICVPPISHRW